MAKFSKRSKDNLEGVHPLMVRLMTKAIETTPIDFTVVEGVRSTKRQQEYYSWGRTVVNPNTGAVAGKPLGRTVTNANGTTKKSNHQVKADGWGHAVDIYPYLNGSVRTEKIDKEQKILANHIQKVADKEGIKIRKGIDWKSPYDPPHYELA